MYQLGTIAYTFYIFVRTGWRKNKILDLNKQCKLQDILKVLVNRVIVSNLFSSQL